MAFWRLRLPPLPPCWSVLSPAETYSQATNSKDASEVIIDEVAGQWVVLLCIPPFIDAAYLWYGVAFILFRFFDITKIGPVGMAEKLGGGIGIMADDIVGGRSGGNVPASPAIWCLRAIRPPEKISAFYKRKTIQKWRPNGTIPRPADH